MNSKQNDTPADALTRLKLYRFPVSIGLGAMVIDIMARTWSDFDMEFVHIFEGVLFLLAAILLLIASRFDQKVSDKVFRIDVWLALAIGLGGIRSALWAGGLDPFGSNNITLILGIIAAPIVFFLLRRHPSPAKSPVRSVPAKSQPKIENQKRENDTTDQPRPGQV
jgi:phosphate/sulfate permease